MRRSRCKYCSREIVWARVEDNRWRSFEKIREIYTLDVVLADWAPILRTPDEDVYQPHGLVCPKSDAETDPPPPAAYDEKRFG